MASALAFAAATTVGVFTHKIYVQYGTSPTNHLCPRLDKHYNFAADTFHTKKVCSRLSSKKIDFYTRMGHFTFLIPLLNGGGA